MSLCRSIELVNPNKTPKAEGRDLEPERHVRAQNRHVFEVFTKISTYDFAVINFFYYKCDTQQVAKV
jgi:hypothetical protein